MATYEIEYTGDYTSLERQDKSIADIKEYLGIKKEFNLVLSILITMLKEGYPFPMITFGLGVIGIQGYPAWAFIIYAVNEMEV